ncbi:hypothetical protein NW762_008803 [Fusarium torreyae]|uniref:Peptidase M61 catalytic domain-containing protein n=1 Tax=Fusarium torreyae TaxID=1237075 RepID=A0A9W8RXA3_9HYPO|nr:hypothetical protein NW762_008803 [Fusarium torreyae]
MLCTQHPSLRLRLTPEFDENGVSALSIFLKIDVPFFNTEQPIFLFDTFTDNVPGHPYRSVDVNAYDDDGPVVFTFHDIPSSNRNTQQEWRVNRQTKGSITLELKAFPRKVSETTPLGARIDLRRDQGGLQGVGSWFLPRLISDQTYSTIVEWDIPSDAPAGTRCVWSLGEGHDPVVVEGPADIVCKTVFMVGPIQSYPDAKSPNDSAAACYWFGNLPPNFDRAKTYNTKLYSRMASFFEVEGGSYRVFIRKTQVGYGGTGFLSSYVLEYDDSTAEVSDDELLLLFTHEMVHSFAEMSDEEDGYDNDWFREGLAELYSSYLPYRFGLRDKDFLIRSINHHLQGYFSSPKIHMDIRDATSQIFDDWYAEWIGYKRGCAYLLFVDCLLRKRDGQLDMSKNGRIDRVIIDLARRWRKGQRVCAADWLVEIRKLVSPDDLDLEDHFWGMIEGRRVMDFENLYFDNEPFCSTSLPILEFGFDKKSRRTRVISGVVQGSNAEAAGLRDGLALLSASQPSACVEDVCETFRLFVDGGGRERLIEFLPRTKDKAPSWQVSGPRNKSLLEN